MRARYLPISACVLGAIVLALMVSAAPSPVYARLRMAFDISMTQQSVIFVAHTVGTIVSLFGFRRFVERSRDRSRAILAGTVLCLVGAVIFAEAGSFATLVVARSLIGLGTGLISGSATAYLVAIWGKARVGQVALMATIAITAGSMAGPALTSVFIATQNAPTRWPFLVCAGVAGVLIAGFLLFPRLPLRAASRVGVSAAPVEAATVPLWLLVLTFGGGVAVSWSCIGLVLTFSADLAQDVFGFGSAAISGCVIAAVQGTAGLFQIIGAGGSPRRMFITGALLQAVGILCMILALVQGSSLLAGLGLLVMSGSYGLAFVGAAAAVNRYAPQHRLVSANSYFYLVAYCGNFASLGIAGYADHAGLLSSVLASLSLMVVLQLSTATLACLTQRRGAKLEEGAAV